MFASRPAGRVSTQIFIRKFAKFFHFFTTNASYLFLVLFLLFLPKVHIKWTWVCYGYWLPPPTPKYLLAKSSSFSFRIFSAFKNPPKKLVMISSVYDLQHHNWHFLFVRLLPEHNGAVYRSILWQSWTRCWQLPALHQATEESHMLRLRGWTVQPRCLYYIIEHRSVYSGVCHCL